MNNTFSLDRFWLYTKKHYIENKRFYISLFASYALLTFFINFNINNDIVGVIQLSNMQSEYKAFYWIGLAIISLFSLSKSIKGIHEKPHAFNSYLLPITNLERIIFIILNSTVAIFAIYTFVIYVPITTILEQYYDVSIAVSHGVDITNSNIYTIGNLFSVNIMSITDYEDWALYSIISIIALSLNAYFVIFWGYATFRKRAFLYTVLISMGVSTIFQIMTSIIFVGASFGNSLLNYSDSTTVDFTYNSELITDQGLATTLTIASTVLFLPLIPLLITIWKKIYKKQVSGVKNGSYITFDWGIIASYFIVFAITIFVIINYFKHGFQ